MKLFSRIIWPVAIIFIALCLSGFTFTNKNLDYIQEPDNFDEEYLTFNDRRYNATNDGSFVRWSISLENQTKSITCEADSYCTMNIEVLPWTDWYVSATYFEIKDGKVTNSISVNSNCSWSSKNDNDFFADEYGYVYIHGTSGKHTLTSSLKDYKGHSYTARINFTISNVNLNQAGTDRVRCAMLDLLAEDRYNILSNFGTVGAYLSEMNIGQHKGESPLLQGNYENGARIDHVIYASLANSNILKVDHSMNLVCTAIRYGGTTYIAYKVLPQTGYSDTPIDPEHMAYNYDLGLAFFNSLKCNPAYTVLTGDHNGSAIASYVASVTGCNAITFYDWYGKEAVAYAVQNKPYEVSQHYKGNAITFYRNTPRSAIKYNSQSQFVALALGYQETEGPYNKLNTFLGSGGSDNPLMTTTEYSNRFILLGSGDDHLSSNNDAITNFVKCYNNILTGVGYVTGISEGKVLKEALQNLMVTLATDYVTSARNIISGGSGDDFIIGSVRDDDYVYCYGDGSDVIYDFGGNDRIFLVNCNNYSFEMQRTSLSYDIVVNGRTVMELRATKQGRGKIDIYQGTPGNASWIGNIERGDHSIEWLHYLGFSCPVNVHIKDPAGNTAVLLTDGFESSFVEDFGIFGVYYDGNEYVKSVLLTDPSYTIVVDGIDNGYMKYSSFCYDFSTNTSDEVSNKSIPIKAGALYYPVKNTAGIIFNVDTNRDGVVDESISDGDSISLSKTELNLEFGETAVLTANVLPINAEIVWDSSDTNIVAVDNHGKITAVGFGEVLVGAMLTSGSQKIAYCRVSVSNATIDASNFIINGLEKEYPFSGEPVEPDVVVSYKSLPLLLNRDYSVVYTNQIDVGTASVKIEGLGYYSGSVTLTYNIISSASNIAQKVDKLIAECNANGFDSDYEKAVWLHNWLINNADYDFTYSYYGADGVLLNGTGVCQSYANAYQLLLNALGIENEVIASSQMNHAWNLVKIDGIWCHIDCTWDDPAGGGMENQFYFGMNDDLIARNHIWNKSNYPSSSSLQNYYPIRNGTLVFSNASELDTLLVPLFTAKEESFTILYIGTDPDVTAHSAFEEWYSNNNWKYGIRSFAPIYGKYDCSISEIIYTEPWAEPVNKLGNPVDAPSFSMNSPVGNLSLNNYRGNGVVLIFGREGCLNTRGLLQRLQAELDALHNSGIEVLISVEDAETYSDIQAVKKDYPSFQYCYEQQGLLSAYLEAVDYYNTYDTGWVTYPCVFIVNGEGKITYYSTGYVSNLDELVSEAFAASNLNPLPVPGENQYYSAETGNANLSYVRDGNVKRALQAACADSTGVFFLTNSMVFYSDSLMLEKWEEDYSLLNSMGLSFVACFEELSEEERQAYPHVTFVEYDDNDPFFWDLLGAVSWDFSQPAYYRSCYFLENNGHIADYINGGTLSIWDRVAVFVRDLSYDMTMPAQLQTVDEEAFSGGRFTSVDLGKTRVTSIEAMSFADCPNLRFIRLPDSLVSIDSNAFLYSDNVVFVCSGNSAAAVYADANSIPIICP